MPYIKPPNQKKRRNILIISNAGQVFGTTADDIRKLLQPFCSDPEQLLITLPEQRSNSIVTFPGPDGIQEASAALAALSGKPCELLGGRVLTCKYAKWVPDDVPAADDQPQSQLPEQELQLYNQPVACTTEEANIPGLYIIHDFVTADEEQQLLAHIDQQPWLHLKKRRVQHYGYKFEYTTRGVDLKQQVGAMPEWSLQVVQRVQKLPDVPVVDQLTVNEYTPGVGIAPHVDAHSSFTGSILSLSLLGSCIMVFRKAYVALAPGADSVISSNTEGRGDGCLDDCGEQQQQQGSEEGEEDRQVNVYLPPRSLVVMTGESRYAWQHYIPHRKSDWVKGQNIVRSERRVSLTFRKVRGYPCDCQYAKYCDSQLGKLPPPRVQQLLQQQQQERQDDDQQAQHAQQPQQHSQAQRDVQTQQPQQQLLQQSKGCTLHDTGMNPGQQQQLLHEGAAGRSNGHADPKAQPEPGNGAAAVQGGAASDVSTSAQALEDAHVHQVYDVIASHFSSTRFAVWPKVRAFLDSLPPSSVVADVGCGNGKYLGVRHDLAMLGSDRSAGLASVAAARLEVHPAPAADVFVCDALQLSYRPCSCDAVLSIAVLHHISSRQRRLALLQQLAAVLRPGGRGLVTVWATQQEDPAKTIQRWHRIQPQAEGQEQQQQQQQQQQEGQVVEGPDYFVPWHLPFHKVGGLAASSHQQQQQQQLSYAVSSGAVSGSKGSAAAAGGHPPSLAVDESKRAVVLQRYYHLFEEGELEGLVGEVPGLEVVQVFYDRSNWCVEFRKQA